MRMATSIRRGFICRMKLGNYQTDHNSLNRFRNRNALGPQIDNHSYAVVHCTGYIKNWPPNQNVNNQMERLEDGQHSNASNYCLIAIARLQVTSTPDSNDLLGSNSQSEFISRHSLDGKFTFVDQRVMGILGYEPQELLDKIFFDFLNPESQIRMRETFENVLKLKGHYVSCYYKIKAKNDVYVELKTTCYAFINPYTNEVEYIVCTNLLNNQALDQQQIEQQQNHINQLNQLNQHMDATSMRLQQQTQHQQYNQLNNNIQNTNGLTGNEKGTQQQQIDYSAFTNPVQMANSANNRVQQLNNLTNQQTITQDRRVQQLQTSMYPPSYDPTQQMHYAQQQQQNPANHALLQMDQQPSVDYNHHQAYQQMSSPSSRSPTTYTQLNTAHQTGTWANQWPNASSMDTSVSTNGQQSQANQVGQQQAQQVQRDEMGNIITNNMNMVLSGPHDHTNYEQHDLNMYTFPE